MYCCDAENSWPTCWFRLWAKRLSGMRETLSRCLQRRDGLVARLCARLAQRSGVQAAEGIGPRRLVALVDRVLGGARPPPAAVPACPERAQLVHLRGIEQRVPGDVAAEALVAGGDERLLDAVADLERGRVVVALHLEDVRGDHQV